MSLRHTLLIGSLTMVLGGCVVAPHPHAHQDPYYDRDYYYSDDDYYDYQSTPSYQGYFYVRVIFIDDTPYYVEDDRHVRPIPRHLHDHFRKSPFRNKDRRAPVFNRDSEVRDGYQMSRVIYFNNAPYYVEDGRAARPLPNHMHDRFRYSPFNQSSGRTNGDRSPPPMQRDDGRRNEPPAYGREWDRREPPAYGRERERNEQPAYDRERGRNVPSPYDRERERNVPPAYGRDQERMTPQRIEGERANGGSRPSPFGGNENVMPPAGRNAQPAQPPRQEERVNPQFNQRDGSGPRGNASAGAERRREESRPQTNNRSKEQRPDKRKSGQDDENEKDNGSKRERTGAFR